MKIFKFSKKEMLELLGRSYWLILVFAFFILMIVSSKIKNVQSVSNEQLKKINQDRNLQKSQFRGKNENR